VDAILRLLNSGLDDRRYQFVVWAFVVGSICHLLLPRVWQWEWLAADLVYLAGLGVLVWRGAFVGWVLAAVGLAIPLLFHRDPLTQSVILLVVSGAGVCATGWAAVRCTRTKAESGGGRAAADAFLRSVRGLTIVVYALAAFHKLNADFLDPTYSCAVYGLRAVAEHWNLAPLEPPGCYAVAVPILVLGAEAVVALLHAAGVRRIAWTVALAFHIVLTFTLAPAFVFVMLVGHAAFATGEDLELLGAVLRRRWPALTGVVAAATSASLWMHGGWPPVTLLLREVAVWGLIALVVGAFPPWTAEAWSRRDGSRSGNGVARWLPAAVVVSFAVNGVTPYLGLQYQHTAAMVSNLRIDRGCWNSIVVPEAVRIRDPYIRVEEVYFGEPGRDPEYERVVREHLWSPPQIRQMRRNWCGPGERPLYLRGSHRGESFEIEDLCAGRPLPFGEWRVFGVALFGDLLRFQKNLKRDCPQQCIH